jgi:hypothetical protein
MTTITICASVNFYKQVIEIQEQLEAMGFGVIVPATASKMKEANDFEPTQYKSWFGNADDYHKKTALMDAHFKEVANGDVTLVVNNEKHGVANYIGGNVLMEMAIAFYLKKPIYVLNQLPTESNFLEEIMGLNPTALKGDLSLIKTV